VAVKKVYIGICVGYLWEFAEQSTTTILHHLLSRDLRKLARVDQYLILAIVPTFLMKAEKGVKNRNQRQ